ncbi:AMP-binding protein [Rhodococcus sovatensis]|uniref:AMP-binding protein n=1 Tax=Rhodococcus sovatensis TaxID=1805840 RepID=A0ABZ2PZ77_9NOCA
METVADLLLAREHDSTTALLFEDRRITWAEHVAESRRWAAYIEGMLDADAPRHIGVLLANVPEFSYLLGAAALGGFVLVGLNSTRSGPSIVDDARRTHCQLILTDSEHIHLVPNAVNIAGIELGDRVRGPVVDPAPQDLLMLVFTSGTSGEPKAVRCTHDKVVTPGTMLASRFQLGPSDTVYVSMPLFHSNAIMAGWAVALAAGANLALRRTFSASGFLPDVRRFGATYANYVGTPLSYVLATPPRPDDRNNPLRVVYGNEATPGAAAQFADRFAVTVVDGFGSSEGGISIARTPDTPPTALGPIPEGVNILDASGNVCAIAEFDDGRLTNEDAAVGELVNTAGRGMFCGYYDDEDADADRMRGGMYWSGDLAYQDADGFVYFAGRSTGWMRVGGENLASAPIERILLRHSGIHAASVYGVPACGPGDRVMAAIVIDDVDSVADVMEFLTRQPDLARRARPELIRICTELPRTATHKVLTRKLQRQRWNTSDPVWMSAEPTGPYRRLSELDRQGLEKSIGTDLRR